MKARQLYSHDGKIYLTYSASATGECYCMGMLSIEETEDLLDPRAWKKGTISGLKKQMQKEGSTGRDIILL